MKERQQHVQKIVRTRKKAMKIFAVKDIKNDVFMNDYKFMSYLLYIRSRHREEKV